MTRSSTWTLLTEEISNGAEMVSVWHSGRRYGLLRIPPGMARELRQMCIAGARELSTDERPISVADRVHTSEGF